MGKGTGLITACLGRELKAQLLAAVQSAGTTQSRLVRGAIAAYLDHGVDRGKNLKVTALRSEDETRVRTSLPRNVADWYAAAARSAGTTQSSYLRAQLIEFAQGDAAPGCVRARAPGILSAGSLREDLVESNAHLAAIERNLNRISYALDAGPAPTSSADKETLVAIGDAVTKHLDLVSRTLTAIRAPRAASRRR